MEEALTSDTVLDLTVMIDSVFFVDPEGTLFNGSGSNAGGTRILKDCDGNSLDVFTSTDREFAYQEIPTGMGRIYGIISEYEGNRQLLLRSINDVAEMTLEKCAEKMELVTVEQFNTGDYFGQTVRLENVQFDLEDANYGNGLFNGTTSNATGSKTLTDCDGNTLIVFTDSDSPLSTEEVPTLHGYIIGEANAYNSTQQLLLRTMEDVAGMTESRCEVAGTSTDCGITPTTTYFSDDFESQSFATNGWITKLVTGTLDWAVDNAGAGNSYYAKMSNYSGGNSESETWLISPPIDISAATAPLLSFRNAYNYNGDPIEVYVTTSANYSTDSLPATGTWTQLSPTLAPGNWDWECSTDLDLSAHIADSVYVAFKYTGSATDGSTWEIDDVIIKE